MSEVSRSFVIEAPVKLHLRPVGDLVSYFGELFQKHPVIKASLQLDSVDPGFDPQRHGKECKDPKSMTDVMMFSLAALKGWDTEKRFKVVLTGPEETVAAVAERVQCELKQLVGTWTKYAIWNRTMRD